MITLADIYSWLGIILEGFGNFMNFLDTSIGDIVGVDIIQDTAFGNITLAGILLGAGIVFYIGYTLVAWFVDILP